MSFLLDALRKSELERNVGEIPKLTPELPPEPPAKTSYPFLILIIVLVLVNIATLFYITAIDRAGREIAPNIPARAESPKATSVPIEKPLSNPASIPANTEVRAEVRQTPKPGNSFSPSFPETLTKLSATDPKNTVHGMAELAPNPESDSETPVSRANRKAQQIDTANQSSLPKKNTRIAEQEPEVGKTERDNAAKSTQLSKVSEPSVKPEISRVKVMDTPRFEKPQAPALLPPREEAIRDASDGIPLLSEMPRDFQRELPALNINVFVYSDISKERFVIVNMSKYSSGEKIDNGPEILEIRPDSLVLKYLGETFRIKRP
ncbi:MAG: general secretion pathway protein GspB [Methylococcales bacterium]